MGGVFQAQVAGDSMWPTLRTGDCIHFSPALELIPGSVVVAKLPSGVVAHRMLEVRAGRVLLQGDNCTSADPEIDAACVLGTVIAVERGGRRIPFSALDRGPQALGRLRVRVMQRIRAVQGRLSWS